MQKSRADVKSLLASIEYNKDRYVYLQDKIIPLSTQDEYDRTVKHYDDLIERLKKEIKTLPIGYRYTGTYFIKKPYLVPAEFEEHSGSIFMRENLVSWQIEKESGILDYGCYRAVFKKPYGDYVTREDAEPVYEKEK